MGLEAHVKDTARFKGGLSVWSGRKRYAVAAVGFLAMPWSALLAVLLPKEYARLRAAVLPGRAALFGRSPGLQSDE